MQFKRSKSTARCAVSIWERGGCCAAIRFIQVDMTL
jgi:hypothetical protein